MGKPVHLQVRLGFVLAIAVCAGGCDKQFESASNNVMANNIDPAKAAGPQNSSYKPCPGGGTTREVLACQERDKKKSESIYIKYRDSALNIIDGNDGSRKVIIRNKFNAGQAAFMTYKNETCSAVFENWADGTIAPSMEADCEIRLVQLQTHNIWSQWLTHVDSTPPILPEPTVEAMPWERWKK
ncbi:MAG: lysozyme inhibitor LprI family protein [Pseudomonadota bacterium]